MRSIILILIVFASCQPKISNQYRAEELKNNLKDNLLIVINLMDNDIPDYWYKVSIKRGFNLNSKNNGIIGLNIYDLNTGQELKSNFENNHIYHLSPVNLNKSFSYISCVFNHKVYFFKAINCPNKGNTLEEVKEFIQSKLPKKISPEILGRLDNYRDYGEYLKTDPLSGLNCDYLN